jgi:outer membrane receptor protein involved in Fe transport
LSWHVTDDILLYYTRSQGFRAGQFNRSTSCHNLPPPKGPDIYCVPAFTVPDNVTNNEIGWKTEWLDHHLQLNGAVYQEIWSNAQTGFFDPQGGLGNLAFATNGPSYRVRGVESSVIARVTHGLTVQASAAWNSSSQTNSPFLIANGPGTATPGQPITSVPNPYGPIGSPTSYSPPFSANARARYEWTFNDYSAFVQVGAAHQAHMITATGYVPAFDIPPYTSYDAAAGVGKDAWTVQIFGQNLTNVNSALDINQSQFILVEFPLRPRVLGIRISYKFREK